MGRSGEVESAELGFRYRHSNLKEREDIVLSARIAMVPGDREALLKERQEILALRHSKHPDLSTHPCAGSFFRNVEPTSKAERRQAAGFFLEEAGAKTMRVGGAVVFEKHANIIIKTDDCRAQDVYELSKLMHDAVLKKFKIDLVREVRLVGEFQGMPENLLGVMW